MATKKTTGKYKCDQCRETFNLPQVLGSHRRRVHGIIGTTPGAIRRELQRKKTTAPAADQGWNPLKCARCEFIAQRVGGLHHHMQAAHGITRQQRKENQLAKLPAQTITLNGQAPAHHEGQANPDGIPDALIAVASGRFIELCRSMAFEYDLPSRLFAARVAAFIYGTQVR